jgi:hypothetical protein
MSEDRKYQDREIRQILDLAIGQGEDPAPALPAVDGLTLRQLQEVGREVGVPPDRTATAVAAFEGQGEMVPRGTTLGLPTSVGRIVPLPRSPTDHEWELLIAELRTTFGGKGEVTSHGSLREWSNGTLHVFLEPTASGHRLRFTDSSPAIAGVAIGGIFLGFALMIFLILLGKENAGFRFVVPAFFSVIGGGLAVASALALPKWASRQEHRMEQIGREAVSLLARPDSGEG